MRLQLLLLMVFGFMIGFVVIIEAKRNAEERPRLVVHQDFAAQLEEGSSVKVSFVLYNAGSTEARDVKITLPAILDAAAVQIEALGPGAKLTKQVEFKAKEPMTITAKDVAARVEYHGKGSSLEFLGQARPSKDLVILSSAEFQSKTGKHWVEWFLYFCTSFGVGVVFPASKLFLESSIASSLNAKSGKTAAKKRQ